MRRRFIKTVGSEKPNSKTSRIIILEKMALTKGILDAAYNGFKASSDETEAGYGLDWQNLTSNKIAEHVKSLFEFGINPMFKELGLDIKNLNISVELLDKINFAYASYLYESKVGYDFDGKVGVFDLKNLRKSAIETYCKEFGEQIDCCAATAMILESNGSIIGQAIADNIIIINKDTVIKTLGLHLICHEIMHLLANKKTVGCMRGGAMNMNDEAVNEYFARLATYFYINSETVGQEECRKIAGLTSFENNLFAYTPDNKHDINLGLYGKLMATDPYMKNNDWNKMAEELCVEYIKKLAQFYFEGKEDPLK